METKRGKCLFWDFLDVSVCALTAFERQSLRNIMTFYIWFVFQRFVRQFDVDTLPSRDHITDNRLLSDLLTLQKMWQDSFETSKKKISKSKLRICMLLMLKFHSCWTESSPQFLRRRFQTNTFNHCWVYQFWAFWLKLNDRFFASLAKNSIIPFEDIVIQLVWQE